MELDYKVLDTHELEKKILGRKKYSPDQVEIIRNMSRNLSKKIVCCQLEKNHKIKISSATLSKIWSGNY